MDKDEERVFSVEGRKGWGRALMRLQGGQRGRDGTRWGQVDSDMKALVPLWGFRQG